MADPAKEVAELREAVELLLRRECCVYLRDITDDTGKAAAYHDNVVKLREQVRGIAFVNELVQKLKEEYIKAAKENA